MKHLERCPVTGRFIKKQETLQVEVKTSTPIASIRNTNCIVSAKYGTEGNFINVDPIRIIKGKKVNNRMAGSDPAPKIKKKLIFVMSIEGKQVTKEVNEGDVVEF